MAYTNNGRTLITKQPLYVVISRKFLIPTQMMSMTRKLQVLLVEDTKIASLAVKSSVTSLNWQLDIVETGQEAVLCAQNTHYDLILMDLGLPDISGITATKMIKQHNPRIPIVALTAHGDDEHKTLAQQAGMCDFIQKPFTLDKIQRVLTKVFHEF